MHLPLPVILVLIEKLILVLLSLIVELFSKRYVLQIMDLSQGALQLQVQEINS